MKSKTKIVKVRRIGRKKKALPPHTWEAHPTANQGEVNKTLIIAVVTIIAIIALAALLFFSDTFVGEAIFVDTGLSEGQIGFVLSSKQDSNVMNVDDSVTLPLIAHFGTQEISGFNISIGYDSNYFEATSCEGSETTVFADLNLIFGDYVIEQNVYCDLETERIHLYYAFIPPMDGLTKLIDEQVLADITITAINPGMEITIYVDEVQYSESVVDGLPVLASGKSHVALDILPVNTPCEKLMQACYPVGAATGNLRCTSNSGNDYGSCTSVACDLSLPTFNNHVLAMVDLAQPKLCDKIEKSCQSAEDICFPVSYLNIPGADPDHDYCLNRNIVDAVFNDCNGMESLCLFKEMVYGDECGLNQGDCSGDDQCAGELTCTGTNDAYDPSITFCEGDVKLICTPDEFFCIDDFNIGRCGDAGLNYVSAGDCAGNQVCQDGACVTCTDEDEDSYCLESISIPSDKLGVNDCNDTNSTLFKWMKGYPDLDKDGFGSGSETVSICTNGTLPETATDVAGDCNDTNTTLFEWIDGYLDFDKDGFGSGSETVPFCTNGTLPEGLANNSKDCNDTNNTITVCGAGTTCEAGACIADDIIILEGIDCTLDTEEEVCGIGLYCVEKLCTNVTGKVILSEGDLVAGTYNTKTTAIEDFPDTPFNVFTILFGPNNETLVSESRVINGLTDTSEIITSITFIDEDVIVSRKLVNVYDKLPGQSWTVHGRLETYYE